MANNKEQNKYRRYGLLLYFVLKLVSKTLRIKLIDKSNLDLVAENHIFAFWHNKLLGPTICLRHIEKKAGLASPSKDGELISVPLEKMGFTMIRGSSDKNSIASVLGLLKAIKKGYSIGTPVDGPKGPIYEVKPGLIYLAQKSQRYIIPTGTAYSNKWIFKKAWDKFQFPKLFAKVVFIIGEPITVPKDADIDEYCILLMNELKKLDKEAENYLK